MPLLISHMPILTSHFSLDVSIDLTLATFWPYKKACPTLVWLGCFFRWSQAILQKVQERGLQRTYTSDEKRHVYICWLSLSYLPCEHIRPIFQRPQEKAVTPPLQEMTTYITTIWPLETNVAYFSWSVFDWIIHANNDVEGWYHHLNQKVKMGSYHSTFSFTFYMRRPSGLIFKYI